VGCITLLLLATCSFALARPGEITICNNEPKQRILSPGSFVRSKEAYDAIGISLLNLPFAPPAMQVPNLRNSLVYTGQNGRPDTEEGSAKLHFSLSDGKCMASVVPGEKLYLLYDRKQNPPKYIFSPNNAPTALWIQCEAKGNEALVTLLLRNEKGEILNEPQTNSEFTLAQKEMPKPNNSNPWELGKWRVDGTLLARQHSRWYGQDRFLEKHGGDEYQDFLTKQRIDFGEEEEAYSVYIGLNDILIWKDNRWHAVKAGKDSYNYPLLQVKKIDDRLMSLVLWDGDGKNKISLNLLKSSDQWKPQSIEQDFKFVAARTRSQYVFEINKERVLLRPQDWLVLTDTGWKKLTTAQEIDDYVERKINGPLFVFDGVSKKDDKQVLVGTIFNASRTEMQSVEMDLSHPTVTVIQVPGKALTIK
jgi:hypothetical protein